MGTPSLVGRRLRALRKRHKLTIRGLAAKAGVRFTTIDGLERGYQQRTAIGTAIKLAKALGVDRSDFVPELKRTG